MPLPARFLTSKTQHVQVTASTNILMRSLCHMFGCMSHVSLGKCRHGGRPARQATTEGTGDT